MIASPDCVPASKTQEDLQVAFLHLLRRLEWHACIYFRHVACPATRDDRIADTVALAWRWFVRLNERGKSIDQFVLAFIFLVARAVKSGRRVTGQAKSKDVMSPLAQQRHGFQVEPLPTSTRTGHEELYGTPGGQRLHDVFEERLVDHVRTPPDEQAMFRIDFAAWLESLTPRERHIIEAMAGNEHTLDISKAFGVTPGWISQMRREFWADWERFCGDGAEDGQAAVRP
jgi:hypothetical protein